MQSIYPHRYIPYTNCQKLFPTYSEQSEHIFSSLNGTEKKHRSSSKEPGMHHLIVPLRYIPTYLLESEAWEAGPKEEFLQHPSYRGLESYTSGCEKSGQKRDISSSIPNTESGPDGPRGQMRERTDPVLMRAWHPGSDVPQRGPTWTTGDYSTSKQVSKYQPYLHF